MKALKAFTIILVTVFALTIQIQSQQISNPSTVKKEKSVKKMFPHVSIAPVGGAIFPLTRTLREEFKPGGLVGLDIGYRLNKEVGLVGQFAYIFMGSKTTGAPIGQYLQFSAGPRYFFTHPKLKSAVFLEAGAGAYNFTQKSYVNPSDTTGTAIPQIQNTKAGIYGGIGASVSLSNSLDILAKGDYHNVFTQNGSQGFLTVKAGLEFRFR